MKECYIRFLASVNGPSLETILKSIDSKVSDGYNRLHIMFNSPGGSVAHGLALYNVLKSLPIEVHTYNIGSVDSIGVVVFCSGDKRYSVPNARFLIHPVQMNSSAPQDFDEHKINELQKSLQIDQKNIIGVIAQTSQKPISDIEKKMLERATFNSQEAKRYGLIDSIVEMPFIPLDAEIISIPESSANPPQRQPGIVLPGGIQIGFSQNYTSMFDYGIGFTSSQVL